MVRPDEKLYIPYYFFSLDKYATNFIAWLGLMHLRDREQITFITLNEFCPLRNLPHLPVLNGQYEVGWNTKQN